MATVTKKSADNIIKINVENMVKRGESKCLRIVKYENKWNGESYGVIFEGDDLMGYHNSPNCYNPTIYWENPEICFSDIEGKYLILRPNKMLSEYEIKKLINADYVRYLQIASYEAEDFCEILGDAYMNEKNIEFYCEEIQIFKIKGTVSSTEIKNKLINQFIGALEFKKGDFNKLKRNQYTKCQSKLGIEKCRTRVKEIIQDAW